MSCGGGGLLATAKQHSIKRDKNNMNKNQTNLVPYSHEEWEQWEWDHAGEPVKKKPRNRGQNRKVSTHAYARTYARTYGCTYVTRSSTGGGLLLEC